MRGILSYKRLKKQKLEYMNLVCTWFKKTTIKYILGTSEKKINMDYILDDIKDLLLFFLGVIV